MFHDDEQRVAMHHHAMIAHDEALVELGQLDGLIPLLTVIAREHIAAHKVLLAVFITVGSSGHGRSAEPYHGGLTIILHGYARREIGLGGVEG